MKNGTIPNNKKSHFSYLTFSSFASSGSWLLSFFSFLSFLFSFFFFSSPLLYPPSPSTHDPPFLHSLSLFLYLSHPPQSFFRNPQSPPLTLSLFTLSHVPFTSTLIYTPLTLALRHHTPIPEPVAPCIKGSTTSSTSSPSSTPVATYTH